MEMNLYPWQKECLERWFANRGRGMVQAATGTGKTRLALSIAYRLQKEQNNRLKVKIVVPTGALMRQWNLALRDFLAAADDSEPANIQNEIGMRGSGFKMPADRRYMIYVINSARYELARQILSDLESGDAVLLIADECHRYESEQNRLIFEFLPYIEKYQEHFFSLGLSATLPSGQAQSYLSSVLGKKIYSYGISRATALHNICRYDIFHVSLSFEKAEYAAYQEITDRMNVLYSRLLSHHPGLYDMNQKERFELLRILAGDRDPGIAEAAALYMKLSYKRKSLVCLASARTECACELVSLLPSHERILIFGERVSQADELHRILQEQYPGRVGRYHSRMGQQANRNALDRFCSGETRILITCKALDEGFDVPDATVGIILSGTSMQRQRIQRLGRIIRKKEGKEKASLYYLHIADTAEDGCFLPDTGDCRITELEYRSDTRQFVNARYDQAAGRLLTQMSENGTEPAKLSEMKRCLRLGRVRTDWLYRADEIDVKIREARYTSDKNYWITMKKITAMPG